MNRAQRALDLRAPLEDRRDLGGRDAGPAAVRQPQVALVERCGAGMIAGLVVRVRIDETDRQRDRVVDFDAAAEDDGADGEPLTPGVMGEVT